MRRNELSLLTTLGAALALAACGGGDRRAAADSTASAAASSDASAPAASSGAPATPAAGGKVIVVQMITDGVGNRFEPNKLEAKKGDVIRFTLKAGVHNVDFLPDSNPGKSGLPPKSDLLQLPGQTVDVRVTFDEGHYYFQCDPHALLGMTGRLEVED
ncbi:MAG TPA: plastocyanin/azurin family copper-binding protein [Gemmatimonadaceae bacterium]|jgi:plastocyanin|nr:plastocyanin/azurin family copper-binding protein [Gemmatimonadaceae bacterium]